MYNKRIWSKFEKKLIPILLIRFELSVILKHKFHPYLLEPPLLIYF